MTEAGRPVLVKWWWAGIGGSLARSRRSSVGCGPICCDLTPQGLRGRCRFVLELCETDNDAREVVGRALVGVRPLSVMGLCRLCHGESTVDVAVS